MPWSPARPGLSGPRIRARDVGLLVLRVVPALSVLVLYGLPDVHAVMAGGPGFLDPFGLGGLASAKLAAIAEVGAASMLVLGLASRLSTVPLMFAMAVSLTVTHAGDPLAAREAEALYLASFAALSVLGPGRLSLDHLIDRATAQLV